MVFQMQARLEAHLGEGSQQPQSLSRSPCEALTLKQWRMLPTHSLVRSRQTYSQLFLVMSYFTIHSIYTISMHVCCIPASSHSANTNRWNWNEIRCVWFVFYHNVVLNYCNYHYIHRSYNWFELSPISAIELERMSIRFSYCSSSSWSSTLTNWRVHSRYC